MNENETLNKKWNHSVFVPKGDGESFHEVKDASGILTESKGLNLENGAIKRRGKMNCKDLADEICNGKCVTKEEALALLKIPVSTLLEEANRLRKHFHGDSLDLCSIINGKSGSCPEDCKYCAQSLHSKVQSKSYPLLSEEIIVSQAIKNSHLGIGRFSIVTSGYKLNADEVEKLCRIIQLIRKETDLQLCCSCGFLSYEEFGRLKEAGVSRSHINLETSRRYFPQICTTHSFDQKVAAIQMAKRAGMEICSGGIVGMGENMEDRIEMAMTLREIGAVSVPINILNPIKGTLLEEQEPLSEKEILQTIALFRFILPKSVIRLAGGREKLRDHGKRAFYAGANGAICGEMLTTQGVAIQEDLQMLTEIQNSNSIS